MQQKNKRKNQTHSRFGLNKSLLFLITAIVMAIVFYACSSTAGNPPGAPPPAALPVIELQSQPATTYQEFSASLEGSKDIEIRPQADGYLEKIYVDEGAYVRKGQLLFQVNDRPYKEQLNNARATLAAAQANLTTAEINVSKLTPLVQANIVSDVQLKTAKAAYAAASANVSQAQSMVSDAAIRLGYTQIKAPADGYLGRIPYKTGSLVGLTTPEPLTVLSEIKEVHVYFSFSEKDFLLFKDRFNGKTIEDKVKQLPPVELQLADNSIYPQKGKVETVSGQFNNGMGAISLRATFPNTQGLLRSGNTGRIRIPYNVESAIIIPQEATFELQDKVFVFVVADSNKVVSTPISISGKSGNYYLVEKGIKPGEKIVFTGLDRLKDGAVIQPQRISMDSVLKAKPL